MMEWDFQPRLKEAIEAKGWSKHVLSQRSGLSYVQINRLLNGKKPKVQADTVRKLARALEVTTDYLLGMDESDTKAA